MTIEGMRRLSTKDQIVQQIDQLVESLFNKKTLSMTRPSPSLIYAEANLAPRQIRQTIGLMRINHAGEIAAQGLYQGQAATAKLADTRQHMQQAALEEKDHLAWCQERLNELGGAASYLDPVWYIGAFLIGAGAGLAGDRWSLGFIAETEKQVSAHLERHLKKINSDDRKTQSILLQMKADEERHAETAVRAGAKVLPRMVKILMHFASKLMVTTAYYF